MSHPLNKHIANAFQDFEGLHIAGTIPLREEMLNDLLAYVLQNGVPAPPPAPPSAPPAAPEPAMPSAIPGTMPGAMPPAPAEARARAAKPDVNALLKRVKKAQVRFEDGRAIIDFEVGV